MAKTRLGTNQPLKSDSSGLAKTSQINTCPNPEILERVCHATVSKKIYYFRIMIPMTD